MPAKPLKVHYRDQFFVLQPIPDSFHELKNKIHDRLNLSDMDYTITQSLRPVENDSDYMEIMSSAVNE